MDQIIRRFDELCKLAEHLRFVPAELVDLHKRIPLTYAGALVAIGILICLFGAHRFLARFVLAPLAFFAGLVLAPKIAAMTHLSPRLLQYSLSSLLGIGALVFPPLAIAIAAGLGGALAGSLIAGKAHHWIGFAVAFLIAGASVFKTSKFLTIVLTSVAGAAIFTLGAIRLLSSTPLSRIATAYPTADIAFLGAIALLASIFQLKRWRTGSVRKAKVRSVREEQF